MSIHELLTPNAVSKMLHVEECTLCKWRYTKKNFHKHVKVGSRVMYIKDEVEEYINSIRGNR